MSSKGESLHKEKFRFAIDRGGTFTDVYSECPNGEVRVMKLLSVDPAYPDAPREGIRRILEQVNRNVMLIYWSKSEEGPPARLASERPSLTGKLNFNRRHLILNNCDHKSHSKLYPNKRKAKEC